MTRVAVIGVGMMGSAIAGRLLDSGGEVFIFDTAADRCTALARNGAHVTGSAYEATCAAEFIICSLNSAAIVDEAVFGDGGIAGGADANKLLIDMSSIDPTATRAMAARLRQRSGMGWVDAPLSGGAAAAAKGTLTLMVGGSESDVARAMRPLSHLSAHATHLGAVGAGQTVKLVNQLLCANAFLAVAEAVRFAEALGVDAALIPGALAGGRADSRILQEFMAKMARRDYSPTGRIDNMLKDLENVESALRGLEAPLPVTNLITQLHRSLVAAGLGPADSAQYMQLFEMPPMQAR